MAIGCNLLSFGLRGAWWPQRAVIKALEAGCEFCTTLPTGFEPIPALPTLFGIGNPESWKNKLNVVGWEHAWNPAGSALDVIRGMRSHDPDAPKLQDWLVSPDPARCKTITEAWLERTKVALIVHSIDDYRTAVRQLGPERVLLEINPGMFMTFREIVEELKNILTNGRRPFCLDLRHLREVPRPDQAARYEKTRGSKATPDFSLGDWRPWIPYLVPHARLIDFQTSDRDELEATLRGEETELMEMVRAILKLGYTGDWRIEIIPIDFEERIRGNFYLLRESVRFLRIAQVTSRD